MDCFYAAVEVKYNPSLKGKPLGIGGPPNSRSVLCTASYEARKYGVRAAMPSSQAVRLCPSLILVPPQFNLYKKESQKVREIFQRFTNKIQPLSLDEAYLDVTDCTDFGGSATLIAQEIRRLIFVETGLTASAGVAPNKFLAKIASDWKKPNGQFVIRPQDIKSFMVDLPVDKIFGVGKVTAQKMYDLGIKTCGDLQKFTVFELHQFFGSRAQELHDYSYGIDERDVITEWERKSLTVESTFDKDLMSLEECQQELFPIYEDFLRRLKKDDSIDRVRGIVVKLKFFDFKQTTHERVFKGLPSLSEFESLLENAYLRRQTPVRLIGLGVRLGSEVEELENSPQLQFAI
ncbi:DNA polymerase IV [Bdellovibrio bacteriovorus W]|nr:DNA polymerase IV [Bdellovibrio bacteriovorus W]